MKLSGLDRERYCMSKPMILRGSVGQVLSYPCMYQLTDKKRRASTKSTRSRKELCDVIEMPQCGEKSETDAELLMFIIPIVLISIFFHSIFLQSHSISTYFNKIFKKATFLITQSKIIIFISTCSNSNAFNINVYLTLSDPE